MTSRFGSLLSAHIDSNLVGEQCDRDEKLPVSIDYLGIYNYGYYAMCVSFRVIHDQPYSSTATAGLFARNKVQSTVQLYYRRFDSLRVPTHAAHNYSEYTDRYSDEIRRLALSDFLLGMAAPLV